MVDTEPGTESDLRRRAAWLLVMLAVVAVLFIVVISALVKTNNGGNPSGKPGALDSAASSQPNQSTPAHSTQQSPSATHSSPATHASSSPVAGTTKCPSSQACVLQGDAGNGIGAVNAYRTQHGLGALPGTVSAQAQACALSNGSNCSGGWAETYLATPNGAEAVKKMLAFSHVLDPQMKNFEVGWAYSPSAHMYYFAIIHND
ncbi:MAG TPA: hypothetical protein VKB75_10555 [Jatrophihabitans sp.]|nr:hypothetical protein [Jatrophihabitans sp.]